MPPDKQKAIIDPLGHDRHYGADGKTLDLELTNYTDPPSHRTETHYDGTRRDHVIDARGFESGANVADFTTEFIYDALGRAVITKHPKTVVQEGGTTPTHTYSHIGYDGLGRKAWESEITKASGSTGDEVPASAIKDFYYDISGRLAAVALPLPKDNETLRPRYEYKYDGFGNLVEIWENVTQDTAEPPNVNSNSKRVTKFTYDELHNKTSRTLYYGTASAKTEYWQYDTHLGG